MSRKRCLLISCCVSSLATRFSGMYLYLQSASPHSRVLVILQSWSRRGQDVPHDRHFSLLFTYLDACKGICRPRKGSNRNLARSEVATRGYASSTWMTYRQATVLGGQVRKGEHGTTVVYANVIKRSDKPGQADPTGADRITTARIPVLRAYIVTLIRSMVCPTPRHLSCLRSHLSRGVSSVPTRSSPRAGQLSCIAVAAPATL